MDFIWNHDAGWQNELPTISVVVMKGIVSRERLRCVIHYNGVIMTTIASQNTSLTVVYSTVYSDADQRKHQSSASLAVVWEFTGTGEFPAQRASYAENVSIWWRHHEIYRNIIKPVHASHGNIFGDKYNVLCDKAQKAIFAMKRRLKATGYLPPSVMFLCSIIWYNLFCHMAVKSGEFIGQALQLLTEFSFHSRDTPST